MVGKNGPRMEKRKEREKKLFLLNIVSKRGSFSIVFKGNNVDFIKLLKWDEGCGGSPEKRWGHAFCLHQKHNPSLWRDWELCWPTQEEVRNVGQRLAKAMRDPSLSTPPFCHIPPPSEGWNPQEERVTAEQSEGCVQPSDPRKGQPTGSSIQKLLQAFLRRNNIQSPW